MQNIKCKLCNRECSEDISYEIQEDSEFVVISEVE